MGIVMSGIHVSRKRQNGFTFIEILVSIVILAVGLLSIAGLVTTVIKGNVSSKKTTTAIALAQTKIEELKNKPFTDPELEDTNASNNFNLSSTISIDHSEEGIDENGEAGGYYNRIWNVANNIPSSGIKTVEVIITWQDNGAHSISFTTAIAE